MTIDTRVSLSKSLFLGNIVEENLFPFPQFSDGEKETLAMVLESVNKFMAERAEDFRHYDVKGEQPMFR